MVGILSDVGNYRPINEDSVGYYVDNNIGIYVIADGMGGHNAGEVASKLAVDSVIEYFKKNTNFKELEIELENAIRYANEKIYELSKKNNKMDGMGTTLTACLIREKEVVIANVGDSSCYVISKDDKIKKITKDHSLVQQLLDNGSITEEEALCHPNKNIITRALGTYATVEVDTFTLNLNDIEKVILCSDGLTNDVTPKEMYDIIMKNSNEESCRLLVELSKKKGGRDNISVIVVEGECKDDRYFTGK
ncbi:Stp1/IreP family PP2C-type Ser/Thr phosphatase [Clostridium lundense]|uniref:Stp1/IreP family PP2C-type Ser/Thr phosphatase n=1 Tax=Clostridium lundense TaxID=319475 RepID=UPI000486DEA6|nr:Stp1/IreP family PP2C-type Ser/Thr phosphatase [Clostridium lundense]